MLTEGTFESFLWFPGHERMKVPHFHISEVITEGFTENPEQRVRKNQGPPVVDHSVDVLLIQSHNDDACHCLSLLLGIIDNGRCLWCQHHPSVNVKIWWVYCCIFKYFLTVWQLKACWIIFQVADTLVVISNWQINEARGSETGTFIVHQGTHIPTHVFADINIKSATSQHETVCL